MFEWPDTVWQDVIKRKRIESEHIAIVVGIFRFNHIQILGDEIDAARIETKLNKALTGEQD